jgi:glycosyltransferase involved in cell wall biosynthesis
VERVWDGLAREFARRGHEVQFFCNRPEGTEPSEIVDNVRFRRISSLPQARSAAGNVLRAIPYAARVLLELPEADILVVNDTATLTMLPPRLGAVGRLVMNLQRLPKGPAMRVLYAKAWKLVAVSAAVRKAVAKAVPDLLDRTVVIGNPAHVEVFRAAGHRRLDPRTKTILYTGRIHPEKGLHLLAAAFRAISSEFPAARLRIVGESRIDRGGGGDEYRRELETLLTGLDAKVLDPVNDTHALAGVLGEADVYCYPSLAETGETFGVAVLEACAAGLAPIVSNLDAFNDFVREGETGFVFDHRRADPGLALEQTLRTVLGMPAEQLKRMGEAASALSDHFSYENIAAKYLELFEGKDGY